MNIIYQAIFQTALLILFYKTYKDRDEILWAITVVLAGVLAMIALTDDFVLVSLNIGIFIISLVFFFIDLYANNVGRIPWQKRK